MGDAEPIGENGLTETTKDDPINKITTSRLFNLDRYDTPLSSMNEAFWKNSLSIGILLFIIEDQVLRPSSDSPTSSEIQNSFQIMI